MKANPPCVSVIVATRNRPEDLRKFLDSLLASQCMDFEALIIDQSVNQETAQLLGTIDDPRVRGFQQQGKGKSRALNAAIAVARGEVLLFTDDDCTLGETWIGDTLAVFQRFPGAAAVYGEVVPYAHEPAETYVPFVEHRGERRLSRWRSSIYLMSVMGANMAFQRSALLAIHGFDEALAPGSRYGTAEDLDVVFRLLRRGETVVETNRTSVLHWGGRPIGDGSAREVLLRSYFAIGAMCTRNVRRGQPIGLLALVAVYVEQFYMIGKDAIHNRRPLGLRRLVALTRGGWQGFWRYGSEPMRSAEDNELRAVSSKL